jgi:type I restriction enzyme S subunit
MSGRAATNNVIPGQYAISVGDAEMPCPTGWMWRVLTDVARLESGHTPSRNHPEWWGGSVPWIGIKDARPNHGKTIYETIETTNPDGLANSAARLLPAGTVCLSRTASVGYVVVMGKEMATSQDFVNWVCTEAVVPAFLKYLLIAEKGSLLRFSKGSTHSTIYFPEVKAFRVCLPSPQQQKRIVAKIEALQARSDAAKQALDAIPPLLEKFRESVLAAAFRGDLTKAWREAHPDVEPASKLLERIRAERRRKWEQANPKKKYVEPEKVDTDDLPQLPEGWNWTRAEEICDWITKGTTPASEKMSEGSGDVPYIKVYNLTMTGKLDFSIAPTYVSVETHQGELARSKCYPGDVLMNIVGPPLGKVSIVPSAHQEWNINQAIAIFRPLQGILNTYLAYHLLREWAVTKAKGHAKATSGQFNLTLEICRNLPVPICSVEEQREILRQVGGAIEVLTSADISIAGGNRRLEALNQSILAKAFRGELVPQDPTDEPASVLLERIRAAREANAGPKRSTRQARKPKAAQ